MNFRNRAIVWFVAAMLVCSIAASTGARSKTQIAKAREAGRREVRKDAGNQATIGRRRTIAVDSAVAAFWRPSRPRRPNACCRETPDRPRPTGSGQAPVETVLDAKLDPRQLADLGEQFGVATFLDLAGKDALLPEAKLLAEAVGPALTAKLEDASESPN